MFIAHWPPTVQEAYILVHNSRTHVQQLPTQCCCAWCGRPRSNGIPALIPVRPDDQPDPWTRRYL